MVPTREGDQYAQPGKQAPRNRQWAESTNRGPWFLGQNLARQLANISPVTIQATSSQLPSQIKVLPGPDALTALQNLPTKQTV